jgi:hypothetical protein
MFVAPGEPTNVAGLSSDAIGRPAGALQRVAPFSLFADFTRAFTTYVGRTLTACRTPNLPGPAGKQCSWYEEEE